MYSRFRFRRSGFTLLPVVGALVLMALVPVTASADHFEPNSKKECSLAPTGEVQCTLTIAINDDGPGVFPQEVITVDLLPGTTGATYKSAQVTGGTCSGAVNVTTTPTQLQVDPQAPGNLDDCTIIVQEVLNATSSGQVCQRLNSPTNAPPETVCAQITVPPTTKEQCKDGGWMAYGIFKNQGDCVSFVATQGKNEAGQNQPNQP